MSDNSEIFNHSDNRIPEKGKPFERLDNRTLARICRLVALLGVGIFIIAAMNAFHALYN